MKRNFIQDNLRGLRAAQRAIYHEDAGGFRPSFRYRFRRFFSGESRFDLADVLAIIFALGLIFLCLTAVYP